MKIAIPSRNSQVDEHFGHCEYYTIYTIEDGKNIVDEETYVAPQGCGCKSNVASILAEKNIEIMLAGNIGAGAIAKINQAGINVIRGCAGNVKTVANDYLLGKLNDSGFTCDAHGEDHECSH